MYRIIFHNFDAKLPMTHRLWQVLNYAKTRTVLLCRLMAPPSIMQIPCKQQLPANVINLHLRRINVLSSNQPNFRYIDRKWLKMASIWKWRPIVSIDIFVLVELHRTPLFIKEHKSNGWRPDILRRTVDHTLVYVYTFYLSTNYQHLTNMW